MNKLTIPLLIAASEMLDKKKELVAKLARQLGVPVQELFYHWMSDHRSKMEQVGFIKNTIWKYFSKNTNWKYFFHGIDCDLWNTKDGRFLAVSFGPKGRIDAFGAGDVACFVFTSKFPWPEYNELKAFLFDQESYELLNRIERKNLSQPEFAGLPHIPFPNFAKMEFLIDELEAHKFIEPSDPELCQLVEKCTKKLEPHEFKERVAPEVWLAWEKSTTIADDGITVVDLPKNITEKENIDSLVCGRWIISEKGKDRIEKSTKDL